MTWLLDCVNVFNLFSLSNIYVVNEPLLFSPIRFPVPSNVNVVVVVPWIDVESLSAAS